ncbi:hypothetical protein [Mesorhizobium sp.]|uniref:hypothetical protein n=2 Tax=unclassified Mesorhizobium TaxID=325217 RepID=UPI000FE6D4FD|nr:hypothetical protein [Mesorhizobium sp.]RWI80816.1 MAG: hypothetical protein EOR19_02000 [Mesorhizobium sp.]
MSGNTRPFTMVSPELHNSRRYLSLDDSGRTLMHYYVSGPHQTSCGCSQIKPAYAAADLLWPVEKYLDYRGKLFDAGLIAFDAATDEIYIERWFKHHCKGSWKFGKGLMTQICKIESDQLREQVEAEFASTDIGAQAMEAQEAEKEAGKPSAANTHSRLASTRLMQRV